MRATATIRSEPKQRVVKRSEIPASAPLNVQKGFWEAVIQRLILLRTDEALEISIGANQSIASVRSAIHAAADRLGIRITSEIRGLRLYVWAVGEPRVAKRQSRKPVTCKVCGKAIIRPPTGGSRQFVCAGSGNRKSECQKLWRFARDHGLSVPEAIERQRVVRNQGRARDRGRKQ